MSARAPFFPNGPPTRNTNSASTNGDFQSDPLDVDTGPEPVRLNTSGLSAVKKKKGSLGFVGLQERTVARSSTADPAKAAAAPKPLSEGANNSFGFVRRENSHPLPKIIGPVPVPAAVPLLTNGNFDAMQSDLSGGFKSPAMLGRHEHSFRSYTLDTSGDTLVDDESFDISHSKEQHFLSAMGNGGPRRILVDENNDTMSGTGIQYADRGYRRESVALDSGLNEQSRVLQQHASRKRIRGDSDLDEGGNAYEALPDAKRFKTLDERRISMPREASNPYDASRQQNGDDGRRVYQANGAGPVSPPRTRQSFEQLLKMDTEEIMNSHMELYEERLRHWNGCTMEQWLSGPQELVDRFSELLDDAKNRMLDQIKFYAGLESTLDEFSETLDERQQALDGARDRAIGESRNVLN